MTRIIDTSYSDVDIQVVSNDGPWSHRRTLAFCVAASLTCWTFAAYAVMRWL